VEKTPTLHQNHTQIPLYLPECNRKLLPRIQCQNMWGHPELAYEVPNWTAKPGHALLKCLRFSQREQNILRCDSSVTTPVT